MPYHDDDIERAGAIPQQPSSVDSDRDGDVITLRNVNGELARYRVQPSGRLAYLNA